MLEILFAKGILFSSLVQQKLCDTYILPHSLFLYKVYMVFWEMTAVKILEGDQKQ